jgi:hypothetical protein
MIGAAVERWPGSTWGKRAWRSASWQDSGWGRAHVKTALRDDCGGVGTPARLAETGRSHACRDGIHGFVGKPVFHVWEAAFQVYLANPEEVKNRKSHKTDDKDGWWLAHLLRHAMNHPSFIPPERSASYAT